MKINTLKIAGSALVETTPFRDHRGVFARFFCDEELGAIVGERRIVQANYSLTVAKGAIRGLHYQRAPTAEMKLVRCIRGRIWDVVVDLRQNSPTFCQWLSVELDPETANMVVVPEGCAHGFQALEPNSEIIYLVTAPYTKEAEYGVRFDDPTLQISWPLPVGDISQRDREHPLLNEAFTGLIV
jgi:dTDP-4-dehydrorhamnose 3,5-epimerase